LFAEHEIRSTSMEQPHPFVRDVDTAQFPRAVLQRSYEVPVVVDFWAEWCGPCKVLGPLLEKVTDEAGGAFELVKVDVDQNQELAAEFAVQGIPTVIAFRDGVAVSRFSGAIPEPALRTWVDGIMPSEQDKRVDEARDAVLAGDETRAETIFREVLATTPDHLDAATSLAALLIARNDTEEALIVLGKLAPTPEVERLQSAARLTAAQGSDVADLEAALDADADSEDARLELAKALAARGEFEPALDHLLTVVRNKGPKKDDARLAVIDIFGVLGEDHPLTATYRRQLASALY
jgi:putative thioredoxin